MYSCSVEHIVGSRGEELQLLMNSIDLYLPECDKQEGTDFAWMNYNNKHKLFYRSRAMDYD